METRIINYVIQPVFTGILFVLFILYPIFKSPYSNVGPSFYLIQSMLCFLSGMFLALIARFCTDWFFKEDKV